jgi:hypothetical protein
MKLSRQQVNVNFLGRTSRCSASRTPERLSGLGHRPVDSSILTPGWVAAALSYFADVHLHRARLFRDRAELAKAARLIHDLGYARRYDELADAEAAAADWPAPPR